MLNTGIKIWIKDGFGVLKTIQTDQVSNASCESISNICERKLGLRLWALSFELWAQDLLLCREACFYQCTMAIFCNYMLKMTLTMMLRFELKMMFCCMLACCRSCQRKLWRSKTFIRYILSMDFFQKRPSARIDENWRSCLAHLALFSLLWATSCEGTWFSGREASTVYSLPTISFTFKKYFRNFEYISQWCLDALGVCSATLFQIRTRQTIPYNHRIVCYLILPHCNKQYFIT